MLVKTPAPDHSTESIKPTFIFVKQAIHADWYIYQAKTFKNHLIYQKNLPLGEIDFPKKGTFKNQSSFPSVHISKFFEFLFKT